MMPRLCLLAACALAALPTPAAPPPQDVYRASGACAGFPRLRLRTPKGLCVGLVAQNLGFPRGVAVIGSDIYVTDLGARRPGRGRVLRLRDMGRAATEVVLSGLDQPNGIAGAPGGRLYVGIRSGIFSFDPANAAPAKTVRNIVTGLPGDGLHMLTAFAVAPDGALLVNVGSESNNCTGAAGKPAPLPCPELGRRPPRGAILRIQPRPDRPVDARSARLFATGLRNAMALAITPQGELLAGVNSRDSIDEADAALSDADLPHDTLVRVVPGADFGWPYCYDALRPSPEYPGFDCSTKRAPERLLPPHSAPLGALVTRGGALLGPGDRLVLALHGYRAAGHRIVGLALDAKGRTTGKLQDIVSGWGRIGGVQPRGAPTALAAAPDGSILIVEDHNGTLLRLAKDR